MKINIFGYYVDVIEVVRVYINEKFLKIVSYFLLLIFFDIIFLKEYYKY